MKMTYRKTVRLKDGRECLLHNGTAEDGKAALENFILTHEQTDFLLSYPDEISMSAEEEAEYLQSKTDSENEIELIAEIEGKTVGLAGIGCVGKLGKIRHRAEFGISIDRAYWGLGIGRALTEACIECAEKAGYAQLELDVAAENERAVALYKNLGFTEYGRNPKGFRSRLSGWQELVLMRLELRADGGKEGKT
jgi:RimJ/RimL family protein N-acetyltransferase